MNHFPTEKDLEKIIIHGIYGIKKGKYKSKKSNINYYTKGYQVVKRKKEGKS